jgi:hypothetical protein
MNNISSIQTSRHTSSLDKAIHAMQVSIQDQAQDVLNFKDSMSQLKVELTKMEGHFDRLNKSF